MIKNITLLIVIILNLLSNTYAQDFTVESITNIENQYTRLQKFTGKVTVKNTGTGTEKFSVTNVYLSQDTELNKTEDEYIGFISFWGLDADQSKDGDIAGGANQFGIDAAAGEYYLIVETDTRDEIIETNEDNNIYVYSEKITIVDSDVDITANGWLIQSASTLNLGEKFQISTNFINLGINNIHSIWYEFYLSVDETYDESDIRIGYANFGYFNWANTVSEYEEITVPNTIIKADYNIILRIQDRGQEITLNDKQMSNNTIIVGQVHINGIPVNTEESITLDDVTFDVSTGTIINYHGTKALKQMLLYPKALM